MERGADAFQRGDFGQAVLSWTEAARLYESEQRDSQQSGALIQMAQAYQALGQYRDALKNLESASILAERSRDRTQAALALGTMGDVYIATGPAETALKSPSTKAALPSATATERSPASSSSSAASSKAVTDGPSAVRK